MAEPLTTLSLMASLYLTGMAEAPAERMTYVDPLKPSPHVLFAQNQFGCSAAPQNCNGSLPASQRCKQTTGGRPAGLIWIKCGTEGPPNTWKPTVAPCTCS